MSTVYFVVDTLLLSNSLCELFASDAMGASLNSTVRISSASLALGPLPLNDDDDDASGRLSSSLNAPDFCTRRFWLHFFRIREIESLSANFCQNVLRSVSLESMAKLRVELRT